MLYGITCEVLYALLVNIRNTLLVLVDQRVAHGVTSCLSDDVSLVGEIAVVFCFFFELLVSRSSPNLYQVYRRPGRWFSPKGMFVLHKSRASTPSF